MANYCTVEEIKGELDITTDEYDALISGWVGAAKEFIDKYCNRVFSTVTTTARYFDGAGSILFIDDLVTIDALGFKLDTDGDGVYESTLAITDYELYPLNTTPKTIIKISSNSTYGGFASGVKKGVQITGTWGYASSIPEPIKGAAIIQACRWFKRKDSAFATTAGVGELGTVEITKGLDPDIALMMGPYIKKVL